MMTLATKIIEGNLTEAQLIGVFAEDFHDSSLLNEFMRSFATLSTETSTIDKKELSVVDQTRVEGKIDMVVELETNEEGKLFNTNKACDKILSEAEVFGVFSDYFHDSSLLEEFIKAVNSLSAENTVLFSLADNEYYEEEEHFTEDLAVYRQSRYLYPEERLSVGQAVVRRFRSFGRAIRRAFKLKNLRKIFRKKKSSTIIVDNI